METTTAKSLYKSLRIDSDSVEVKRILDEQVVKSASLFKDAVCLENPQPFQSKCFNTLIF